ARGLGLPPPTRGRARPAAAAAMPVQGAGGGYGSGHTYGNGYGNTYGNSEPATVVGQPVSGQAVGDVHVAMGVPYRVDPSQATTASMPWMSQFPEKRQNNKIEAIRSGGEAAKQYPLLPDERPWNDSCWIFAFVL
ncbi:unnamed protein product, partial [Prorocentrum cordatum]